ncbi:hypothetical protein SPI_05829 [Niveomyces insectorum RCEF 264]|uniref:Uncharacterized protein n=1 Tax=Niveomyces insectorum RCEF 264 TaxID=1081102 RepID=A0A167SHD8_9HYPO|nr:hypothetical protein SPI_05829 [Niveomyces insectorum RCEF 264]
MGRVGWPGLDRGGNEDNEDEDGDTAAVRSGDDNNVWTTGPSHAVVRDSWDLHGTATAQDNASPAHRTDPAKSQLLYAGCRLVRKRLPPIDESVEAEA